MSDVCLLLEGTYPYVAGGVSTWVYQLIKQLHDINFSIVYLGPHFSERKKLHYEIPKNVTEFREFYLFDYEVKPRFRYRNNPKAFRALENFLIGLKKGETGHFDEIANMFSSEQREKVGLNELAYSYDSWRLIERLYAQEKEEVSFLDYFWTWRFVYLPFFVLLKTSLPNTKLYHAVSTGYAGVLGALAKLKFNKPFVLTEHGIYTRERKIEISQADWIYSETAQELKVKEGGEDFFRDWWISLFSFFSRLAYDRADKIISLFEGNRRIQMEEGALPEKTLVIPNGISLEKFINLKKEAHDGIFRVGFMGRVVPIKDVKTFIRACKIIYTELKNVEFYIMGPTDEDKEYFQECQLLVKMEGLDKVVNFTGKINVHKYYPKIDVIVLTSISEGQPIVILEANACGIPVVATDVGSCSELLYGSSPDDRILGASGIITAICDAKATAQAVIDILKDRSLYYRLSETGKKRVSQYYQMDNLIADYRLLYDRYMQELRWPA